MRGRDEATWWRRTARLAAVTIAATFVLAILPFAAEGWFAGSELFGLPFATFLAIIGAPLVVLAAAAFFVGRQLALDRRYDVAER